MPDVRLSGDFKGRKAGEIVELDNDLLSAAYEARVVAKVFPREFGGLDRAEARRGLYGARTAKKAAKKTAAPRKRAPRPDRPAQASFGDKPTRPAE